MVAVDAIVAYFQPTPNLSGPWELKRVAAPSVSLTAASARGAVIKCRTSRWYHETMKLVAVLAIVFIVFPILEFTVLIQMGREIGTVYTILLVFGAGIVGAFLAKMEGLRILAKIQDSLRAGVMPRDELLDGAIVLVAGVLLITPGFLSDVLGMLLLFPPTRYPAKALLLLVIRRSIRTHALRISHIN